MKSLPLRFTISAGHGSDLANFPFSAKSFGLLYLSSRLGRFNPPAIPLVGLVHRHTPLIYLILWLAPSPLLF
jgi:hypothetical protein